MDVHLNLLTVVLMLRVWVMYGKSKKIGVFLSAVYAIALVAALVVLSRRNSVSQAIIHTLYMHRDTPLAGHWSATTLYAVGSGLNPCFTHG